MRRRHHRRGPRRKSNWYVGYGSSIGTTNFLTSTIFAHWAIFPINRLDTSNQQFAADVIPNPGDLTLVRSISNVYAWIQDPDSSFGDGDFNVILAYGLIKWSTANASAIDGSNFVSGDQVPGPFTDATMDWVYRWQQTTRSFGAVSQEVFTGSDFLGQQSRAMRKLSDGEGILQCLELVMPGAMFTNGRAVSWYMDSRMLAKEA